MWVAKLFEKRFRRFFWKQYGIVTLFWIFLLPVGCLSPIFASEVFISPQLGQVRDKAEGPRGKTVVIIEEAHVAYNAQKVLAEILEDLIRHESFRHIFVEGGWGDVSLTGLRHLASGDRRREVAERYLREGKISGEEYLNLTTDLEMSLRGVEDSQLYSENMDAFLQLSPEQPRLAEEILKIKNGLARLETDILTETQIQILSVKRDYETKEDTLLDYAQFLMDRLSDMPGQYPNLERLLAFAGGDSAYDSDKVSLEKQSAIQFLSKQLTKPELDAILQSDAQKNMEEEEAFLERLLEKVKEYSGLSGVPNLVNLENYRNALRESFHMDARKLFEELRIAEEEAFMSQPTTEKQRIFFKVLEGVSTLEKLIGLRLTEDEFVTLEKEKDPFPLAVWRDFFNQVEHEETRFSSFDDGLRLLEPWIPVAITFYQSAREREKAMVDNLYREMMTRNIERAVFITGGFHSRNFFDEFKERGYTVLLVTLRFQSEDGDAMHEQYLKVLREKWVGAEVLSSNLKVQSPERVPI